MAIFVIVFGFILIAVGMLWFFLSRDKGEKKPVGALWAAFGFGLVGAVAAGFIEMALLPKNLDHPNLLSTTTVLASYIGVGVIEEACKFLPLAAFLYKKPYFNERTDGIIYFALAGLGFGVPENILYTLQFGTHTGISRIILTPIFHAATTGIVGYFLVKNKLTGLSVGKIAWPLAAAMLLHGLYDFGLSGAVPVMVVSSLMITVLLSVSLFLFFTKATELDQSAGMIPVGLNNFCRYCGAPNPKHNLYCNRCGHHA